MHDTSTDTDEIILVNLTAQIRNMEQRLQSTHNRLLCLQMIVILLLCIVILCLLRLTEL